MMNAANAMIFAPMPFVFLIGSRVSALRMDPVNRVPPEMGKEVLVQNATLAQVLISITFTLVWSGTSEPNPKVVRDMTFKVENKALGATLSVGRYLIMFCIYVGFSCVIYSINTLSLCS